MLWLALVVPHISARYSYNWDSSQYARGVEHFDIARHQPHPPGYPLWILALKGTTRLTGNASSGQVVLALLFTLAALPFFHSLAREMLGERAGLAATALLAFSPLVLTHAMVPVNYAVDLFVSCAAAWFAAGMWRGDARHAVAAFAVVAAAAGFRQSGATFLLALLGAALWRSCRNRPVRAAAALAAGAAVWLAWYLPTARVSGGITALSRMTSTQASLSIAKTSILFGAPPAMHGVMVVAVCIGFALALGALAAPAAAALLGRRKGPRAALPCWATPMFFALWLAPNLAMVFLLHYGAAGYILLSLPPLVLVGAWLCGPVLENGKWVAAAVAASLALSYLPYERFIGGTPSGRVAYQFLRASPRFAWLVEDSQRELRTLIDAMDGRPDERLIYCLLERPEAPNLRTVTYHYAAVNWAGFGRTPGAGIRTIGWLCDGAGLPADIRARYPNARRAGGNALYSFFTAPAY